MIRITLACVGRLKEDYLKRAEAEFEKRLGAYCQLETKVIMEEKMPDRVSSQEERQILQKETDRLLRKRFKWGGTDSQKTEKFCFLPYNPLYLKA